ncbi:MAG TPA: hypothetical protein H9754_01485 [Candidatus Anaerostipes avistercoris]|uniref:Uncharacterized protein n=1 Tax=Candidatus Anaerostipes avistercoris TaxID=2838462 RepID=A0A9D2PI24_9FIRM|nr:hypothetical protein [Candidatus Anaerostipes avistercoris]
MRYRYTKEKSLKLRRLNEKALEMKGRIARGLLAVVLVGALTTIMSFNANANSSNVYYLGEVVNAGKDTGFSENEEITKKDPHYNWRIGNFFVTGYTQVITDDSNPIFLKTVGDKVVLNFQLEQDIDALNNDKSLMIANDQKAYDNLLYKDETAFGRGALIIRKTDAYQNKKNTSQLYTDYLSGVKVGANTQVEVCEEGDYEVALDYSIRDKKITVPFIDKTIRSTYNDYKIYFTFSVRNGNCMVFPFDVATGEELTNKAITEKGFYLDLAKSRYLEINIKREVLREGATGLTEDVRFNKPASDGEKYTDEGIYTITVSNPYTDEETVKKIYVGTNSVLKAYMTTGYTISDIQSLLKDGATIDDDGNITIPEEVEKTKNAESVSLKKVNKNDEVQFATSSMVGGSICIVLALFIVYLLVKKKKKDKRVNTAVPVGSEESVSEKLPEEDEV